MPTKVFDTWDEYLAHRASEKPPRRKVVFIGLDGASWNLVDPIIAEGRLPNIARLQRGGAWGVLRSPECYVSPPAWASLTTGYKPERTGIYTFGHWDAGELQFRSLSSADKVVPDVWDIASLGGLRSGVVNVPLTYPVEDVRGIMVSGLLTPVRLEDAHGFLLNFERVGGAGPEGLPRSHSPVMTAELNHMNNRFEFFLCDTTDDGVVNYDLVYLNLHSGGEPVSYRVPVRRYTDWIQINHEDRKGPTKGWCRLGLAATEKPGSYVARFSEVLWSADDTEAKWTYPESVAEDITKTFKHYFPSTYVDPEFVPDQTTEAVRYVEYFQAYDDWDLFFYVFTQTDNALHAVGMAPETRRVFATIDAYLGRLVESLDSETTLIIASDHGFDQYTRTIDLNRIFEQTGLLTYKNDRDVDYANSLVFHNLWCVYFNDALLTREQLRRRRIDCPAGADPREALVKHIRHVGDTYMQSVLGRPLKIEFVNIAENAVGDPPDLVVKGTYPDYMVEFWNVQKSRPDVITEGSVWHHRRDGMYILYGAGIAAGTTGDVADIEDIAPTILYCLGLPMPESMDGRVIAGAFNEAMLASQSRYVVEGFATMPAQIDLTDSERQNLEKQLKSLGYIR